MARPGVSADRTHASTTANGEKKSAARRRGRWAREQLYRSSTVHVAEDPELVRAPLDRATQFPYVMSSEFFTFLAHCLQSMTQVRSGCRRSIREFWIVHVQCWLSGPPDLWLEASALQLAFVRKGRA